MVVVDVPVDTGHQLPVRSADVVVLVRTGLISVFVPEIVGHLVHESLRRTVILGVPSPFGILIRPCKGSGWLLVELVLEVHEKEELVLDDRAAYRRTDSIVKGRVQFKIGVPYPFAYQLVACIVVIHGRVPLVGTPLGHGIDGTACKA